METLQERLESTEKQIENQIAQLNQLLGYKKCLVDLIDKPNDEETNSSSID